jgi:hypothetical protein
MKNINIVAMESGDEKRGGSAFSNPQILKFNSLIIKVLIFY